MRASVMNATDAALAAMREHLAHVVPESHVRSVPDGYPIPPLTDFEQGWNARGNAMLKALGDE